MKDQMQHPYFDEARAEEDELNAAMHASGNSNGDSEIISPAPHLSYTDFSERRANRKKWARIHGLIDKVEAQVQSSGDSPALAWEGKT